MRTTHRVAAVLIWGCAILLAIPGSSTAGVVFDVDDPSDVSDSNLSDGLCLTASGTCTLRAAVQQTNALTGAGTDTINIPAGTYGLTILGVGEDAAYNGDLDITDDLDIVGAGAGQTILDARGIDRIFEIHDSVNASITGVTIRGGLALHSIDPSFFGGGIRVGLSASLDLSQCAVQSNRAGEGGGLYAFTGSVTTISDCSFRDNVASHLAWTSGVAGAISNRGTMDLERVEVSGNKAEASFSASVWSHNAVSLTVRNSTLSGNQELGLYLLNTEVDLENSTVYDNTLGGLGFGSATGGEPLTVRNSILSNSGGPDCELLGVLPVNLDFAGEHNLDGDGTCPLDAGVVDLPNTNPQLGPLQDNGGATRTHVPGVGSPVIDVGNNARCLSPDQRGAPRPLDGGAPSATVCDMGAVEVLPCDPPYEADEVLPFFETAAANLFEACYTVTNGDEFRVLAGGLVTWKARDALILQNGFSVLVGGSFEALLDPAAGSFTVLP